MKKKLVVFLIATMMFTLFSGCSDEESTTTTPAPTTTPPNFVTYESAPDNVRIMYPKEWEKMEDYQNTVVLFRSPPEDDTDVFQENLNIVVGTSSSTDLEKFTDANIEEIEKSFTDVKLVSNTSTTLAGVAAREVVFTLEQKDYTIKLMQIYALKEGNAYVITYTAEEDAYSEYLTTARAMIATFEIL